MTTTLLLLAAPLLAAAVLPLIDRVILIPQIGFWVVFAVATSASAFRVLPGFEVAGINVTVGDVGLVILLAAMMGRVLRGTRPSGTQLLFNLLFVIVVLSLVRGMRAFGVPTAVNEARETLYFIAAVLFAAVAVRDRATRDRLATAWLWYASALAVLCLVRWVIVLAGLPFLGAWYEPAYAGMRVILAEGGFVMVQAVVMLLPRILTGTSTLRDRVLVGWLTATVVLLQHRSVWVVLLVGASLVVWRHRRLLSRQVVTAALAGVAILVPITIALIDTGDEVIREASTSEAASTVTVEWRVSGWIDLIESSGPDDVFDLLFGQPYGSGFERRVSAGFDVKTRPHNMYLEYGLRVGLVGVALLVAGGASTIRRLGHRDLAAGGGLLDRGTLQTMVVAMGVYAIPYNVQLDQALLLGTAVAFAHLPRAGRGGAPAAHPEHADTARP